VRHAAWAGLFLPPPWAGEGRGGGEPPREGEGENGRATLRCAAVDHGDGWVAAVVAAYEEEAAIGGVLRRIPAAVCGRPVRRLVVVDGGHDSTAEVARAAGADVLELPENRGQGAALRAGFARVVAEGAEVVVTLDADGQHDPADLGRLVAPVLEGRADFVAGSRRVPGYRAASTGRAAGLALFSAVVTAVNRARVTDCGTGFRAFRAAGLARLRLRQDRYSTIEVLIRARRAGLRYLEVPIRSGPRSHGRSKKGSFLRYGFGVSLALARTLLT
jgi:glycosyltransferase involved in cell wall biosynthesis